MLDIIIVFSYLLILLLVGFFKRRSGLQLKALSKITDKLGSNRLILVATIFASAIGGGTTFGITEKAFAEDIAYTYGLMLAIPVDIIIAVYIIPKLTCHYGAETIGDIMYTYYGNAGRYISGFAAILVSVGLLAAQISVSGHIFEYILQIDYIYGVVFSYSVIILYTTIGGLQSIIFTNLLQFFAMIIAIPTITVFGIGQIGWHNFLDSIPLEKIAFSHNENLFYKTIYAALGFAVINILPTFIQRALLNKNSGPTQFAIYMKSIIYFFFLIFVTVNGIIAFIKYPDISSAIVLPYLIDRIIPVGFQGMVVVGMLAAVMSTADSDLNITSVTLVKDFFKPLFKITDEQIMLKTARIINILIGSFAIVIALSFSKVVDLVIFIAGFWGPVVLVPLIFGLYDIVIGRTGFIIASLSGATAFLIWSGLLQSYYGFKGVFVGFVVNLIVFTGFWIYKKYKRQY